MAGTLQKELENRIPKLLHQHKR